MNYQFIKLWLLMIILLATSRTLKTQQSVPYAISLERSPQLNQFCIQVNRKTLNQKYTQQQSVEYLNDFTRLFTLDNTIFNLFLNLDVMGMNSTLKQNTEGYFVFVVLPLIGLGLLLISGFVCYVLLFCPFKFCLRKKLLYTSCQQFCPTVFVTIFGIAAIACSISALLSDFKLYQGYQQLSCGSTIILDDLINGNVKNDYSTFFAGTRTIVNQLNIFDQQSSKIYSNLSKFSSKSSQIANILSSISNGKVKVSQIPNSTNSSLVLNYNIPLRQSAATSTISSTFPDILGNMSANGSLIGVIWTNLDKPASLITNLRDGTDSFLKTQGIYSNYTSTIKNSMNESSQDLEQSMVTLGDMISRFSFSSKLRLVQEFIYGVTILMVFLLLVSLMFFISYNKMCCRHFIYIFGFFIFFIAMGLFAVSIVLGFATPIAYTGINYLSNTLKNTSSTAQLLSKLGSFSVASSVSACLPNGNGEFLAASSTPEATNYVNLMRSLMKNLTTLSSQNLSLQINSSYIKMQSQLKYYSNNNVLDITDLASISQLKYLSSPKNYDCSAGNFQKDSWIPNINQKDNTIPCLSSLNSASDNLTCKSTTDFSLASTGCTGCMSTYSHLYQFNQSAAVLAYLNKRYKDCQKFNTQMANTWKNYYLIKKNALQPVIQRQGIASPVIQEVQSQLTTDIGPLMESTLNQLYVSAGSVLDPNKGLLGGLNCGVITQDVNVFTNSLYRNTFSYCFHHKIYLTVISFCLLLLLWCNTCVLFRKKKDILNAINFPSEENARVRAQPIPLSGDRIINYNM